MFMRASQALRVPTKEGEGRACSLSSGLQKRPCLSLDIRALGALAFGLRDSHLSPHIAEDPSPVLEPRPGTQSQPSSSLALRGLLWNLSASMSDRFSR